MNLLQRLFGRRKPALNKPVVSASLSFKEQMKKDIIPRIWLLAEKEKQHLNWLIDNNAPKIMIETSQRRLRHFRQRHKEYIEYVSGYSFSALDVQSLITKK